MDGLNDAVGAGTPVDHNGRTYYAEPIGLADIGLAENYLIDRVPSLDEIGAGLKHLAPEVQRELFAAELEHRKNFNRLPPEKVLRWLTSELEGLAFSLHITLSRRYPNDDFSMPVCMTILEKLFMKNRHKFEKFRKRFISASGLGGADVPLSEAGRDQGNQNQPDQAESLPPQATAEMHRQQAKAARRKRQRQRKRERMRG